MWLGMWLRNVGAGFSRRKNNSGQIPVSDQATTTSKRRLKPTDKRQING